MCRNKNYPYEKHEVLTDDGYYLTVFRIPAGKNQTIKDAMPAHRPPILLLHGLMDSADSWIIVDDKNSLPLVLANHGYDVWIMNSRGTYYSKKHKYLHPEIDDEFFDF